MELFKFDQDNLIYHRINKLLYLLKYIGITLVEIVEQRGNYIKFNTENSCYELFVLSE